MIIFSILGGTLGYFALYGILLILNNMDEDKKGIKRLKNGYYPYSNYSTIKEYKPPSKVRNIKPINFSRNKTDDERSNNRYNNKLPGSKINNNSKLKRNLTPDKYGKSEAKNAIRSCIMGIILPVPPQEFDSNGRFSKLLYSASNERNFTSANLFLSLGSSDRISNKSFINLESISKGLIKHSFFLCPIL